MDAQRKAWREGGEAPRSYTTQEWVNEHGLSGLSSAQSGTSIFDPVLCELVYRWFCPEGGAVLDPFAGGSVRGIVAGALGRAYTGLDLRPEQIAANEAQAVAIAPPVAPRWITGDSRDLATLAPGAYDLIFSCPPYADLEVYSDDPADLSTLDYPAFLAAYRGIIAGAVALLKPDRFACFVVGDVRGPQGFYRNFVSDTIAAFADAGAALYNEAILVTAAGSLPIRVGKQFASGRKLGKTHQNVLVFFKGDPRQIKTIYGAVEMGDPAGLDTDPAAAFGEVLV
jgi:DNA modification methylase